MKLVALAILTVLPAAGQYSARRNGSVIELEDKRRQTAVSILADVGNIAFRMDVKGHNVLWFPASVQSFREKPVLSGIPFLGPWANRLDEQAFYANGKRYALDMTLGNVTGAHPIHGFLWSAGQWKVVEMKADRGAAWVTSRLEFYRQPAWIAQFPFAHTVEVTYRLQEGGLEVAAKIENLSAEPMPVSIGFHPYFRLDDSPRDDWTIAVAARTEWVLNADKLPVGETRPIERLFPDPRSVKLREFDIDHVFSDLVRDASGRAVMSVTGAKQKLEVVFGPNYRAAVIYAPKPAAAPGQDRNFICFEPMAGITNAMNLAHRGVYRELQTLPPGQIWRESFWIRPGGF
jgi:aldose 1-epimerase